MSTNEDTSNVILDCKTSQSECLSEETEASNSGREVAQGIGWEKFACVKDADLVNGETKHSAPSEHAKSKLFGVPPGNLGVSQKVEGIFNSGHPLVCVEETDCVDICCAMTTASPSTGGVCERSGPAIGEAGKQMLGRSASLDQEDQQQGSEVRWRVVEEEKSVVAPRRSLRKRKASKVNSAAWDYSDSNKETDEEDSECVSVIRDDGILMNPMRVTRSKEACGQETRTNVVGMELGTARPTHGRTTVHKFQCLELKRVQRLKRLSARPKRRCGLGDRGHSTVYSCQTSESSESELERQACGRRGTWSEHGYESPVMGHSSSDNDYCPPTKKSRGDVNPASSRTSLSPTPVQGNILANILIDIPEVDILPLSNNSEVPALRSVKDSPQGPGAYSQAEPLLPNTHPQQNSSFPACQFKGSTLMVGLKQPLNSSHALQVKSLNSVIPAKFCSTVFDRLNLRKTADRRSRASSSGNSSSATPTLSPKLLDRGDNGEDSKLKSKIANLSETGVARGYQRVSGKLVLGSKRRVQSGNKNERKKGSCSRKDVLQPKHMAEEEEDGMKSAHFRVLRSWESDSFQGKLATRGPMLYALDKFPEKIKSNEPWMKKAKMIWALWRHKVPLKDRLFYTEKAKLNRLARRGKPAFPPVEVSKGSSSLASKLKISSPVRLAVVCGGETLNESCSTHMESHENPSLEETKRLISESQSCPDESWIIAGPQEDCKKLQAIAGPREDHEELQATVGPCEDQKELLATVGPNGNQREMHATVSSCEDQREMRDTVGPLADQREMRATVSPREDQNELRDTLGSCDDDPKELLAGAGQKELQATAGSTVDHEEFHSIAGAYEDQKETTAGSCEDQKELQATAGSCEDPKELQATAGSREDQKELQATAGSHEDQKELLATAGSCEDQKELQAAAGSHEDQKELQATAGSREDQKELQATAGSREDQKELQCTASSCEDQKELQATAGSREDQKELRATGCSIDNHEELHSIPGTCEDHKEIPSIIGSCEDQKKWQVTVGSREDQKELPTTAGSHVDREKSMDSEKLCEKSPALLDLLLPYPSARTTTRACTTSTTTTTGKLPRPSSASNSTKPRAKKATLVKVDDIPATVVDTSESVLVIETVSNVHAACSCSLPPSPHILCVKPTENITATSNMTQSSSARNSISPVRVGILLKEAPPPVNLLDEYCTGVKKTLNPYVIATPTLIGSICSSSNIMTKNIAPLSSEKMDQSLFFPSPLPEANLSPFPETRTRNGNDVVSSRGKNVGIDKHAPRKLSKRRSRSGSSYTGKIVSQSSKDSEPMFCDGSAAGYSITTQKYSYSSASALSSSSYYQPLTNNSGPVTSRSVPTTPTHPPQADRQGMSPHICPRMHSHVSSFVIPQMSARSAQVTSPHLSRLPSTIHESSRKAQRSSYSNSLKMHQNISPQTQSARSMSSSTSGGLDNSQSFSRVSPKTFKQSRFLHDNRSRSDSASSSSLRSVSPALPLDVQSSLIGGRNSSISLQPACANRCCSHKQNRSTVHHISSCSTGILDNPGSPFSFRNLKTLQQHMGNGYTQERSVAGEVSALPVSFSNISLSLPSTDSSSVVVSSSTFTNSTTSKNVKSIFVHGNQSISKKAGRNTLHRIPTTISTTVSSKSKSGGTVSSKSKSGGAVSSKSKSGRIKTSSFLSTSSPLRADSPKAHLNELTEIKLTPSSLPSHHFQLPSSFHQRSSQFSSISSLPPFSLPQTSLTSSSLPHHLSPFPQNSSLPPPDLPFHPKSSLPSSTPSASPFSPLSSLHSQFNASPDSGVTAYPSFGNSSPFGQSLSIPNSALTKMSKWELEQLYYYNTAVLEQHKLLMKTIEDHLGAMEGERAVGGEKEGLASLHLSSYDAYKHFLDFTVEPSCNFNNNDEYCEKFGFGDEGRELNDLILGGTPGQPIINGKYDIYANAGTMLS